MPTTQEMPTLLKCGHWLHDLGRDHEPPACIAAQEQEMRQNSMSDETAELVRRRYTMMKGITINDQTTAKAPEKTPPMNTATLDHNDNLPHEKLQALYRGNEHNIGRYFEHLAEMKLQRRNTPIDQFVAVMTRKGVMVDANDALWIFSKLQALGLGTVEMTRGKPSHFQWRVSQASVGLAAIEDGLPATSQLESEHVDGLEDAGAAQGNLLDAVSGHGAGSLIVMPYNGTGKYIVGFLAQDKAEALNLTQRLMSAAMN